MNNWTSKDRITLNSRFEGFNRTETATCCKSRATTRGKIQECKCCTDVNAPFRIQSLPVKLGKGPLSKGALPGILCVGCNCVVFNH